MLERILLYLGIVAVFWVLFWLYKKENQPDEEEDTTPFAMRPCNEIDDKTDKGNRRNHRAMKKM